LVKKRPRSQGKKGGKPRKKNVSKREAHLPRETGYVSSRKYSIVEGRQILELQRSRPLWLKEKKRDQSCSMGENPSFGGILPKSGEHEREDIEGV